MSTLSLVTRAQTGEVRPASAILISEAFQERYELQEMLGSGAMGMVMRAHDRATNRPVAIKFMVKQDDELLQRFLREGRLMARLSHPNVAPIYDLESLGGHPYIVTELLEGGTLREWMNAEVSSDEAIGVVAACLDGLAACHAAGIVDRDLKPDGAGAGAA